VAAETGRLRRIATGLGSSAFAKLNDLDPQAWLADVLARIADTQRDRELLPWKWKKARAA
jgi:transposase